MSRLTRALLGTLVTGLIAGLALWALGAPVWAAVGFGGLLAELRQTRILLAPPEEPSPSAEYLRRVLAGKRP